MSQKKSWREKLQDSKDLPKVITLNDKIAKHWHGKTMVVPPPLEVDKIMKKVPKGELITINELRQTLAKKFKTDIACPLTSGIFAWISANAAEEDREEGKKEITPYWRTLKGEGELNPKYPLGIKFQKEILQNEGHKIIEKGKRYFVLDYEKKLAKL